MRNSERIMKIAAEVDQQARQRKVDLALLTDAVSDLAARAAVAKSRIDLAKSGEKQWRGAVRLAEAILELDRLAANIEARPPVERVTRHAAALAQIDALTIDAYQGLLRHDAVMDQFGGFAGNAVRLAGAIVSTAAHASPKSKRSTKDADAGVGGALADLLSKPKDRKKVTTIDAGIRRVMTKGAGAPKVVATASSTATDLEKDAFSLDALKQMKAYYPGRLAFMNHSYKLPEDLFGVIESASIVQRAGRHDLDVLIAVERSNERAMQTLAYIKGGTKLGVSVGVLVDDSERQKDGTNLITEIRPLELSIVGIPALQSARTQGASN